MKQIYNQVLREVRNPVFIQIDDQVWCRVGNQVRNQVRDPVRDRVWNQIFDPLEAVITAIDLRLQENDRN